MTSVGFDEDDLIAAAESLHAEGHREVTPAMALERLSPGYKDASQKADDDAVFPAAVHVFEQAGRTGRLPTVGQGAEVRAVFEQ